MSNLRERNFSGYLMEPRSPRQQCEAWNFEHPIGSSVVVTKDNGEQFETTVRYPAQCLNGMPVAWVHGISGSCLLSRITSYSPERRAEEGSAQHLLDITREINSWRQKRSEQK